MKKIALTLITLAVLIGISVPAVQAARTESSWLVSNDGTYIYPANPLNVLLPLVNGYLNFGTFSGSTGYGFRDFGGVLQFKNNAGNWTALGSGGGSGGGSWSTTTSSVPGQLVNYSNNPTDIPCIGGTATTTCKFYFDPNTSRSLLGSVATAGSYIATSTTATSTFTGVTANCFSSDGGTTCLKNGSGTPGGATNSVQYNNSGTFGGIPSGTDGQVLTASSTVAGKSTFLNIPILNAVDTRNFGAVCDGTTNDTNALRNAFAFAESSNPPRSVHIAGTAGSKCLISNNIHIPNLGNTYGMTVFGDGMGTTYIMQTDPTKDALTVDNNYGMNFANMTIQCGTVGGTQCITASSTAYGIQITGGVANNQWNFMNLRIGQFQTCLGGPFEDTIVMNTEFNDCKVALHIYGTAGLNSTHIIQSAIINQNLLGLPDSIWDWATTTQGIIIDAGNGIDISGLDCGDTNMGVCVLGNGGNGTVHDSSYEMYTVNSRGGAASSTALDFSNDAGRWTIYDNSFVLFGANATNTYPIAIGTFGQFSLISNAAGAYANNGLVRKMGNVSSNISAIGQGNFTVDYYANQSAFNAGTITYSYIPDAFNTVLGGSSAGCASATRGLTENVDFTTSSSDQVNHCFRNADGSYSWHDLNQYNVDQLTGSFSWNNGTAGYTTPCRSFNSSNVLIFNTCTSGMVINDSANTINILRILNTGQVGIGTNNPLSQLDVSSIGGGTYKGTTAAPANTLIWGGNVGVGSTSPWAQLSVNPNGVSGPEFAVGSSTKTDFLVTNGGQVGIGTSSNLTGTLTVGSKNDAGTPGTVRINVSNAQYSANTNNPFEVDLASGANLAYISPQGSLFMPNGGVQVAGNVTLGNELYWNGAFVGLASAAASSTAGGVSNAVRVEDDTGTILRQVQAQSLILSPNTTGNRMASLNADGSAYFLNQLNVATTTATSTFPVASSTTFCLSSDCRTAWPSSGGGSYPFTQTGNGTSTLTQFNGGITALASSTIGNGTSQGGLTVSGTATTSNLVVTGNSNVGSVTAGTWNGTTISVSAGGTGRTTLAANQVLVGNGGSPVNTSINSPVDGNTLRFYSIDGVPSWGSLDLSSANAVANALGVANGGTGQTSFGQGWLGINNSDSFISSTSPTASYFTSTSTGNHSTFPYASTTAISAQTICFTGDICRTNWPSSGGGAYPFTLAGNATSTLTQFNGGLTAFASSTIGSGAQIGGLTISGGATTTGNQYISGNLGIRSMVQKNTLDVAGNAVFGSSYAGGSSCTTNSICIQGNIGINNVGPTHKLEIFGTTGSNSENIINLTNVEDTTNDTWGMNFASANHNKAYIGAINIDGSNGKGALQFNTDSSGDVMTEQMRITDTGNVGIGTSSPYAKLSVDGRGVFNQDVRANYFTATSTSIASTFPYASTTVLSASTICISTDCRAAWPTLAYPFGLTGNATSTLTQFNGGLTAYASSTIGNGTQNGGLTISGGATTTGALLVQGTATSTFMSTTTVQGGAFYVSTTTPVNLAQAPAFAISSNNSMQMGTTSTTGLLNITGSSAGSSTKGVCFQIKAVGSLAYIYSWYDSSATQHVTTASCTGTGTTTIIIE